jgi:hypothetical protein
MKSVTILAVAAAALAAPCVQAGGVVLKARIPFNFVVADQQLPSGEYRIVQEEHLVKVYSQSGEQLAVAHWVPQQTKSDDRSRLVFHRHGDQRFLKVIGGADGNGAYFPETSAERGARTHAATSTTVSVAAS